MPLTPSHVCIDEDALVLRARTAEGLAAVKLACQGCKACEELILEVERVRALEHELLSSVRSAVDASISTRTRTDELLRSVTSGSAPTAVFAPATPPTIRGYQVFEELHRGGQGVVYRGVQQTTNRPAAIKLLLAGTLASLRERYRFEREIEIASSLRHPHIVAVFDAVSTSDNRVGYAMDFVDGKPIDAWSTAQRAAQPPPAHRRAALELMAKVCRAVQYAHSRGVMHRDLKPGNVLVDGQNEPRLLDFGLARTQTQPAGKATSTLEESRGNNSLTMPGEFVGTPQYAAPEQLELGAQEVDGRADVYALGIMLYQLVCGKLPYVVDGSVKSIIDTVCRAVPARPSAVAQQEKLAPIDTDLETIVMKALAKDRERRYQTALELAQDIDLLLRGRAIQARRDSTWYVLRKWLSAHKLEAASIGAAAALLLGATIGGVVLTSRATQARNREALERVQREEQAIRAEAVATVIAEILPPPDQSVDAPPSRWLEENLLDVREAIDAGWLSDRPELAAQVQSVLSDIYALRGTRSGWFAEATARNAKTLLRDAYGERDPRVLRMHEAMVAALVARKRNVEAASQAQQLASAWDALGPEWASHAQSTRILLAQAQLQQGQLTIARETLVAALGSSQADAASMPTARGWFVLAAIALQQGDVAQARDASVTALRTRMRLRRDTDADVVASLQQLADALDARHAAVLPSNESAGQSQEVSQEESQQESQQDSKAPSPASLRLLASALRKAEGERDLGPLLQQADGLIALKRWLFGEQSFEEVESLSLIANSHRRTASWLSAAIWSKRAADAMHAAHPQPSIAVVNLYSASAEGYRMVLDFASEAQVNHQTVLEARGLADRELEPIFRAAVYRDAGSSYARVGDFENAIALLQEAIEIFSKETGGQGHVLATGHARLAEAYLLAGKGAQALQSAQLSYELARAVTSMPADQRVDMLSTYARALLVAEEPQKANGIAEQLAEQIAASRAVFPTTDEYAGNWNANANWVAALAARAAGKTPQADAFEARARLEWAQGVEFIWSTYGYRPTVAPPWERYPFPALRAAKP